MPPPARSIDVYKRQEVLCRLEEEGLLIMEGREEKRKYRLTDFGLDVSNYALAEFLM